MKILSSKCFISRSSDSTFDMLNFFQEVLLKQLQKADWLIRPDWRYGG